MVWVRIDDGWTDRPHILGLSLAARWLHVAALSYANRHLTDGAIPTGALHRLCDVQDAATAAQELVDVGLWKPKVAGWQITDPDNPQPSRKSVEARRRAEAKRKRTARASMSASTSAADTAADSRQESQPPTVGSGRARELRSRQEPQPDLDTVPDNDAGWHLTATETEPAPW